MNKKLLITIIALVAVLALLLVLIFTQGGEKTPQAEVTEPTPAQVQTDAPDVPDVTEETEAPTEETIPGEPDPFGEPVTETVAPKPQDPTESTLPGDVDVSLGVVPGESTPDLEDDDVTPNPGTTQQPTTGGNTGSTEVPAITTVTYETYIAMTGAQQQAFIDQFASVEEFVKWYNASKAKYEEEHPDIEIGGDTVIDGSQLMGG